ncbi:serine hydrolase [Gordonia jinghuaiqii]|uniref:Serine hydrolase n=1 Tax=Gordonia jinghuaiqii TaxID=2758710 RepID=A0A7D7QY68_9ACTN|nr:serine hydrolase [Gordonia jinghuaiqii]QMT02189.1 serine hydrolase [Gordonia jinghuaiqii]
MAPAESAPARRAGHPAPSAPRWGRLSLAACSALSVIALVAACDSGSSGTGAAPSEPSGSSAMVNPNDVAAQPLPADAVDKAVGQLDGLVASLMESTKIPGIAVAVVSGGETKYAKGFGVKDVTTGAKVDPNTVFQLASVSKSVGSTVVGAAVTDKTVTWDMPIVESLPWFALAEPYVTRTVTVGDMYSHRSGLPDHAGDKLEDMGYSRNEILQRLRFMPLDPFRISYAYTNYGVTAGGEAVAVKAGKEWATLSQDLIYGPLGMNSTSSRFVDFAKRPDRAVGHVKVDGDWVKSPIPREPDAQSPAGGVSSSVNDMAIWLKMVLAQGKHDGQEIVAPDALLPAVSPQIVSNPPQSPGARPGSYGFGFNVGVTEDARTQFSHAGAFASGAGTVFSVLPSADTAIVVLSNAAPVGAVDALAGEFMDLVQFGEIRSDWRALYGNAYAAMSEPSGDLVGKQPSADAAPAQPLPSYVGTYANTVYGPAEVVERDGALVLEMGPGGVRKHQLTHWDGNTFTFTLHDENAEPGTISQVRFDGPRMTVEYYDDEESDGVFLRR